MNGLEIAISSLDSLVSQKGISDENILNEIQSAKKLLDTYGIKTEEFIEKTRVLRGIIIKIKEGQYGL